MIVVDTNIISYLFIKGDQTKAVKKLREIKQKPLKNYYKKIPIGSHPFYGAVSSGVCCHYT